MDSVRNPIGKVVSGSSDLRRERVLVKSVDRFVLAVRTEETLPRLSREMARPMEGYRFLSIAGLASLSSNASAYVILALDLAFRLEGCLSKSTSFNSIELLESLDICATGRGGGLGGVKLAQSGEDLRLSYDVSRETFPELDKVCT